MTELDDQLAEATDDLLNRGSMRPLNGENHELSEVVSQLYQVIDPATPPSPAYQERMRARLDVEWQRQYAPPTLRLLDRPLVRLAALAAAVVLILAALVVLAVPETPMPLQGAAIDVDDGVALLVLVAVAAGSTFFYWRSRR